MYYKDSHGCLILFDLSNRNTLRNAIKWKTDVDSLCTSPDGRKLPCILIANKVRTGGKQTNTAAAIVVTVVIVLVTIVSGGG